MKEFLDTYADDWQNLKHTDRYNHPPPYYRGLLWQDSERMIAIEVTRDLIRDYERALRYADKYQELILSVGNKTAGETRHETALRYILQAEAHIGGPCKAEEEQHG